MSDSKKIEILKKKKKKVYAFFWSRKVKKRKKILFAPTGTCKKRIS